jgi:hypothetical protein
MNKNFKIARKPGLRVADEPVMANREVPSRRSRRASARPAVPTPIESAAAPGPQPTTRKTIEIPEEYFYRVKMRALERHLLEKELWSEIVSEYFANHPKA